MSVTRRSFLRSLGLGSVAAALPMVQARGAEARAAGELPDWLRAAPGAPAPIRIDSNENPNGPAPEALRAMTDAFGEASRYPDFQVEELLATMAKQFGVPRTNLLLGCGSTEILKVA